jgi:hypothetical protein
MHSNNCSPTAYIQQIVLEIDKKYDESRLQLGISPILVHFTNPDGQLSLNGMQFRGHGMFSDNGVVRTGTTVEYAWMMEILLGDIDTRLHPTHIVYLIQFIDTFITLLISNEEQLQVPRCADLCQHMQIASRCPHRRVDETVCDSEETLKYKMVRFGIDSVHLVVIEQRAAIDVNLQSVRIAYCNGHGGELSENVHIELDKFEVRVYFLGL